MSEEKLKLTRLENEWKDRFDRFTSPEPTREQSIRLIEKIKELEKGSRPADLRAELELAQAAQTTTAKMTNLFLSQWNFYGARSWLLTGIVMLLLTLTISASAENETTGFIVWMKGITLLMVAVMGYAFRSKNEGNAIIEKLSYYSLVHQMFARFLIVMGLQVAMTLPLSLFIAGRASSFLYLSGAFTPVLFFGVLGFISAMWFGQKAGAIIPLFVWMGHLLLDRQLQAVSMFQLPWNEHFFSTNVAVWGICGVLLSSVLLNQRLKRGYK